MSFRTSWALTDDFRPPKRSSGTSWTQTVDFRPLKLLSHGGTPSTSQEFRRTGRSADIRSYHRSHDDGSEGRSRKVVADRLSTTEIAERLYHSVGSVHILSALGRLGLVNPLHPATIAHGWRGDSIGIDRSGHARRCPHARPADVVLR